MDEGGCCDVVMAGLAGSAAGADGFWSTVCESARPAMTNAIGIRPTIGFCFAVILPHLPGQPGRYREPRRGKAKDYSTPRRGERRDRREHKATTPVSPPRRYRR